MENKKYHVVTGLVHTVCKPYRTNSYFKAFIALLYRKIMFGRGHIYYDKSTKKTKP